MYSNSSIFRCVHLVFTFESIKELGNASFTIRGLKDKTFVSFLKQGFIHLNFFLVFKKYDI
jgi:hypothetical protein